MKHALSCAAQDMLEAAIIQKRRLNLQCLDESGALTAFAKILPIDIKTSAGQEKLSFLTTDNDGGIIKLAIDTALITAFEADDFLDPRIVYQTTDPDHCLQK